MKSKKILAMTLAMGVVAGSTGAMSLPITLLWKKQVRAYWLRIRQVAALAGLRQRIAIR